MGWYIRPIHEVNSNFRYLGNVETTKVIKMKKIYFVVYKDGVAVTKRLTLAEMAKRITGVNAAQPTTLFTENKKIPLETSELVKQGYQLKIIRPRNDFDKSLLAAKQA